MLTVMLFVRQMKMALTVDEKRRNCCIKRNFGVLGKSAKVSSSERERWRYRGCGGQCGSIMAGWRNLFPRAMSQVPCLHEHLANAARVKYPASCSGVLTKSVPLLSLSFLHDLSSRTVSLFLPYPFLQPLPFQRSGNATAMFFLRRFRSRTFLR